MTEMLATLEGWLEALGPNRYLQAVAIIVVSLAVAKVTDWLLCRGIAIWARKTTTDFDDRLISYLHRPLFISVTMIGLGVATGRLEMAETPRWLTIAILKTIAVWVWLVFAVRFVTLVLEVLGRRPDRFPLVHESTRPLLNAVGQIAVVGAAVYFAMLTWNIDVTAWLASAGILGLALGFAAQDSLSNLFAGMFILADAPYKVGDFVVLDTGERGQVTRIGMRSTRLLTRDDVEVTIPNSVMGNAKIVNESGGPHEKYRLRVPVGVAYGTDIDQVDRVLLAAATHHADVCEDPEPRVRFRGFGESSLDFELLAWIATPVLRGKVLSELNGEIYKALGREGIEIPFPKRDVYIKESPPAVA